MSQKTEWGGVRMRNELLDRIEKAIKTRPEYSGVADFVENATRQLLERCEGIKK